MTNLILARVYLQNILRLKLLQTHQVPTDKEDQNQSIILGVLKNGANLGDMDR